MCNFIGDKKRKTSFDYHKKYVIISKCVRFLRYITLSPCTPGGIENINNLWKNIFNNTNFINQITNHY